MSMDELIRIVKELRFEAAYADEANRVLSYALNTVTDDAFEPNPRTRTSTLIHAAVTAACDASNFCKILSISPPSHLTKGDAAGNTPLHLAARSENTNYMNFLILRIMSSSPTADVRLTAERLQTSFAKRNKAGRTPLFEAIDATRLGCALLSAQHVTNEALWTARDKTNRLIIERLDISQGGQHAFCQRLLLRLNSVDHFFDAHGVSVLHRVLDGWSGSSRWSTANIFDFVEMLVRIRPDVVRRVVQDNSASRRGTCKDIFGAVFEKGRSAVLPVELAHMLLGGDVAPDERRMRETFLLPRGTSGTTILHLASARGVGHFVGLARRAMLGGGLTAEECIGVASLSGATPMHILCKGHPYDFEAKFSSVVGLCGGAAEAVPIIKSVLLRRDLRGKFPFESAQSARVLEVLFRFLLDDDGAVPVASRGALEALLATSVRTHCFDVFTKVVKLANTASAAAAAGAPTRGGAAGFAGGDTLLALAAEKRDLIVAIRPRRLLDHLLEATHPLRIRGPTISRLLSLTEELVSARSAGGRIHESDASLIASILEKVRRWNVWKRWNAVRAHVTCRQIAFYWNEAAMREKYRPGQEEYLKSLKSLAALLEEETLVDAHRRPGERSETTPT